MYRDVNKQVQAWKKDTCPEVCIFRKRGVITTLATWLCLRVHLIPVRDSQWTTESTSLIWKSNVVKHLEMASLPKRKTRETRLGGYILKVQYFCHRTGPWSFYQESSEKAKEIGSQRRGMSWHITIATRRAENKELQVMTFVHVFQTCNQDNYAVLSVMKDVIGKLKSHLTQLKSVFYRQHNAKCYHCGATIVGARFASRFHGVSVKRLDFSDPQGGKGPWWQKGSVT